MKKYMYIILSLQLCAYTTGAQEKLKGKLSDALTNEPLAGAIIKIKPNSQTIVTDNDGLFELSIPKGNYTLQAQYLNYAAKEIPITLQEQKPLMVGDKVPASFWEQEHTVYQDGKTTTQTLAAYKGKALILDFWATWCTSCISSFPKLDTTQRLYLKDMNVLLVNSTGNGDDVGKIDQLFVRLKNNGFNFNLPSLINSELRVLFPHRMIPFYVWIDDKGIVVGLTNTIFLNEESITSIVKRKITRKLKPTNPKTNEYQN